MKVYEQWQCPNCERIEQVDVEDYLTVGIPMCTECGDAVIMERLSEHYIVEKEKGDIL